MSWEQISNDIVFYAFFVATKVGKTGLADVTVDVYRTGTEIVTAAAGVEVGDGLYKYTLVGASVTVAGEYVAVFKTANATVDAQHIPALWVVGRSGVEFLDASVLARTAGLIQRSEPPTVGAVADAVWDETLADHVAAGSTGKKLTDVTASLSAAPTAAAIADAVWDELSADHVTAATTGYKLSLIGSASVTISAPVASDGTLTLVRGDDYAFARSRHLTVSSTSWPDLSAASLVTSVTMTVRRRKEAFGTGSDGVLFTATDRAASRVWGSGTQTVVFELTDTNTLTLLPGTSTGKYDIEVVLSTGEILTLATGTVTVTEDQTRH